MKDIIKIFEEKLSVLPPKKVEPKAGLKDLPAAHIRQLAKSLDLEDYYNYNLSKDDLISKIKEKQEEMFKKIFINETECDKHSCYGCPVRKLCEQLLADEVITGNKGRKHKKILELYMSKYYEGEKASEDINFKKLQEKLNTLTEIVKGPLYC